MSRTLLGHPGSTCTNCPGVRMSRHSRDNQPAVNGLSLPWYLISVSVATCIRLSCIARSASTSDTGTKCFDTRAAGVTCNLRVWPQLHSAVFLISTPHYIITLSKLHTVLYFSPLDANRLAESIYRVSFTRF